MTFCEENVKHLALDYSDDWQMHGETKTVSVMVSGLEKFVCGFFGTDLTEEYPDGWIDGYATVDPEQKEVTGLYFSFVSNAGDENDRELDIRITNPPERRMLYKALRDDGLDAFCAEAVTEFSRE